MIDDENPAWTSQTTAAAFGIEDLPATLQRKLKGGRPRASDPKTVVTLRLPASVLAAYEGQGPNWRARMEKILTDALTARDA
jgi:uncharacterized protein (DUF4415 family)